MGKAGISAVERPDVFQVATLERLNDPVQSPTYYDHLGCGVAEKQTFGGCVFIFLDRGIGDELRLNELGCAKEIVVSVVRPHTERKRMPVRNVVAGVSLP